MPTVSVIIPSYNHAAYLPGAIESVLAQTYKDYEILVVDDGSTDATPDAVKPYLSRIRFYALPHAGIAANYNRGVARATGKILAFLESDDAWAPTYLERAMAVLESEGDVCGLSMSRQVVASRNGEADKTVGWFRKRSAGRYFTTENILASGDWGMVSTPVLRRGCLEDAGRFDERFEFGSDSDMALRFSLKHKLAYVDEPLYWYRRHPGSTTRDATTTTREALRVALHFAESQPEYVRTHARTMNLCLGNFYSRLGSLMLQSGTGSRREILDAFRRAVRYRPRWKHFRRLFEASVFPLAFLCRLKRRRDAPL